MYRIMLVILFLFAMLFQSLPARAESDAPELNHHLFLPVVSTSVVVTAAGSGTLTFNCPPEGGGIVNFYSPVATSVGMQWRFKHNNGSIHYQFNSMTISAKASRQMYTDMTQGWRLERMVFSSGAAVTALWWHCT